VSALRKEYPEAVLSIDTFRASVAAIAIDEGANIINDVSGGDRDGAMFRLVAEKKIPYVLTYQR
jgi:dihydropteroate synthase